MQHFRAFLSIAHLSIFLLPGLVKVWIVADFKINQDYIAQVLCINKDEPMTICGGQCYLAKELQKAEKEEKKELPCNLRQKVEIPLFFGNEKLELNNSALNFLDISFDLEDQRCYSSNHLRRIFRPPKAQLILIR